MGKRCRILTWFSSLLFSPNFLCHTRPCEDTILVAEPCVFQCFCYHALCMVAATRASKHVGNCFKNRPKWNEKSMKNGPKIKQKSIKNGPKIDQKWTKNQSKIVQKSKKKKSRKSQPVKSEPDPEITACEIRKRAGNHSL